MQTSPDFTSVAIATGYDIFNGFKKVGFAIDSLAAGQISFTCVENTNKWLASNFGVNFSIFYEQNALPCVSPQFARFHIRDAIGFEGDLIATSYNTLKSIKGATRSKRYYYINDIEWWRPWFKDSINEIKALSQDDSIVKFCRSQDHRDRLLDMGFEVSPIIVEDFNIDKILEIINENKVSR
jgi:hypothetical protein